MKKKMCFDENVNKKKRKKERIKHGNHFNVAPINLVDPIVKKCFGFSLPTRTSTKKHGFPISIEHMYSYCFWPNIVTFIDLPFAQAVISNIFRFGYAYDGRSRFKNVIRSTRKAEIKQHKKTIRLQKYANL